MTKPHTQPQSDAEVTFPPMSDALLDGATLDQLVADIAAHTRVHGILLKQASHGMIDGEGAKLEDVLSLLKSGKVRGVQIRYVFDGDEYWDTLMSTPNGTRLVRVRHD